MTDDQLIQLFVSRRDEHAFRQLYARHSPAVFGLLRRIAGPTESLAEDILQDTWLRASELMSRFRGDSAFRTWLTGIALNCYRERRRRSPVAPEVTEMTWSATGSPNLEVAQILDTLSVDHREVLVLHDVEGYTHEEIAKALGIEAGTSKSRLSRARQIFRERWRNEREPRGRRNASTGAHR
jgi:RNA polymerase sigma-70 factor, ECF subfamily